MSYLLKNHFRHQYLPGFILKAHKLEVFIKPNQNTDEIRNRIIKETGMVPNSMME